MKSSRFTLVYRADYQTISIIKQCAVILDYSYVYSKTCEVIPHCLHGPKMIFLSSLVLQLKVLLFCIDSSCGYIHVVEVCTLLFSLQIFYS